MRHPLPYAFARSSQLLLEEDAGQHLLWHGEQPNSAALSEVLRKFPIQHLAKLPDAELAALAALLSAAFDRAALAIARGEPAAPYRQAMRRLLARLVGAEPTATG